MVLRLRTRESDSLEAYLARERTVASPVNVSVPFADGHAGSQCHMRNIAGADAFGPHVLSVPRHVLRAALEICCRVSKIRKILLCDRARAERHHAFVQGIAH